jgi:MFS family permease
MYLAPIIGTILGQIVGHWLHDSLGSMYMARQNGRITPEARLIAIWLATPFYITGIVVMGYALGRHWHYMALVIGWGPQNFGIIIITTAINAYVLDAYPEGSGEVAALLNAGRAWGGFAAGYVQIVWAERSGTIVEFGSQAGISAAAFFIVVGLQFFGERLRKWQGPMNFATQ